MTRATFHRLITQALSLLGATLVVLLLMNLVTNQRIESEKQTDLQKTLGEVLTADHYSQISLASYLEEYPSIQTAYKAYDTKGTALGYVIDVKSETETGVITTRMSFSPDGNTLIALRVLGGDVQSDDMLAVQSPDFYSQFSGVRVPAALLSDLPEQNVTSKEYPAIAGLTDGIFREQQQEEDLRNSAQKRQPGPGHKPLPTPRMRYVCRENDSLSGECRTVTCITGRRHRHASQG